MKKHAINRLKIFRILRKWCIAFFSWPFQMKHIHSKKDPIYVIPEMKLRGLVLNFDIQVSVSDLYISTIGLSALLEQSTVGGPMLGLHVYKSLTDT